MLRMMPSYVFSCFNVPAFEAYAMCIQLLKRWRHIGIIILQDDHKGLVMRCKIPDVPHMCVKACEIVVEIRVAQGNRRVGTCVARFTLEKGSQSSFHFLHDNMEKIFEASINKKPHEVTRMLRVFI
ncbi:hypothetical protein BZA05DRAFT_409343 [Tricharina praecox]|uniref:uncharacterized protein n=1 Tax=Tricharina praecox TaxID=43433 RepID=UPI00222104EA|nr:uncharacterized protein BZA05DRAFT_409343 [Tricharina praecox]KAI5844782.1 hypothetical protein BZA05DRAFT_409343 [Tricharina praecox]